ISPGSSSETRDGGWTFCREHAAAVIGKDSSEAKAIIARDLAASKVAATALVTAIEMLEGHPLLTVDQDTRLPLLTPFNSSAPGDIEREVEQRLKDGFRTFKIKVGKSAEDDARRVKLIQRAIAGRATMRLDANRAYSRWMPVVSPWRSIRPALSCSSSRARPRIGRQTQGWRACRLFP